MRREFEEKYHAIEEMHWWFRARRHVLRSLVGQLHLAHDCRILEVGCSSGVLLQELQGIGLPNVTGIDISEIAIEQCRSRGIRDAYVMDAQRPTLECSSYDLIIASDVLEHLADPQRAASQWAKLLRPGGRLIVFVPAFMKLWSAHDEANRHVHRYTLTELHQLISEAGLDVGRASYWNFALYFPIRLVRLTGKLLENGRRSEFGDLQTYPRFVNQMLYVLLRTENSLLTSGVNFPIGVSAMAIASKNGDN